MGRNLGRVTIALGVVLLVLFGSLVTAEAAVSLGAGGKRGPISAYGAGCKYGSAPYPGYLRTYTSPPRVKGTRARVGPEWVRYKAWLVDQYGNTVQASGWSGFLWARDWRWATWSGQTSFTDNWRGNYRIDLRIEWWNQTRRIGWRAIRITDYYYYDEWNTYWGGPFTSCMRQPV